MAVKKNRLTIEDLWKLQRIGTHTLSPDGRVVCAEVASYAMESNECNTRLWLFNVESKQARELSKGSKDEAPQWSPDGKWIAFTRKRDKEEQSQVYLIAPDGGEARQLTEIATGAEGVRWFPDSKRLVFISWVWPELDSLKAQAKKYKEEKESKVKAHLTDRKAYRYWDEWITHGRVPHLFVVDIKTGACRDILAGTALSLPYHDPSAQLYDISPDGKEIALTVNLAPDPIWGDDYDIVAVNSKTGQWKNLTAGSKRHNFDPRYSPNGKWLAYLSCDLKRSLDDQACITLRDRTSGKTQILTRGWDRAAEHLSWSPDSKTIYCIAEEHARQHLWQLSLAESTPRVLIKGGRIAHYALSADGKKIAFARANSYTPAELFIAGADGQSEVQLDRYNASLLKKISFGEVKDLTIKGWGGESVQMWVTYPPDFDAKKKWPLLHCIHGGPHSAWQDEFHFRWNPHLFAAQGYVVVGVNYHGSSGWGQAYLESNNQQYGVKEFADVEAATDFMLKQGYIDPQRLAASGGSYGGYMVAYMNGHTDRYRAYVCHAGCYDWVSMMATDVYPYFNHELGAFHWDDEARVMSQSPHHYAGRFRTPTLVIHGELDYRVPGTQGLQYYSTLKTRGVPAKLLYFPDENHWILKPQNARLWVREFLSWLREHVRSRAKK